MLSPVPVPQTLATIELPVEFSESLELSFQSNSRDTAERFVTAYDEFAKYGTVTPVRLKGHARLKAATQQAQILSDIMAVDLNGDRHVTRAEYNILTGLPSGHKKAARLAELFECDINQNEDISVSEAIDCLEYLNAARPQNDMRPIESYLMLFDLDGDAQVQRGEVVEALGHHLTEVTRMEAELRAGLALR